MVGIPHNPIWRILQSWIFKTKAYRWTLAGPTPRRLTRVPPAAALEKRGGERPRPRGLGRELGPMVNTPPPHWFDPGADRAAMSRLHGFQDLAAIGTGSDRTAATVRQLVQSWLANGSAWHPVSWAPEVLGSRIAAWLGSANVLVADHDELGRQVLGSLAEQVRHLRRVVATGRGGVPRLVAIRGLVYGAACGLGPGSFIGRGLAVLEEELATQIAEDGSHVERSPAAQACGLSVLLDIWDMLGAADLPRPGRLKSAIGAMAQAVRFFRHGDGGLALFNGSSRGRTGDIDALVTRANGGPTSVPTALHNGFQRLSAGPALVIQDAGAPAASGFDADAHAGTLSFEMSYGHDRMVVNCGTSIGPARDALRATAAHSTAVIEDVNSAEVLPGDGLGRRPSHVECLREETDGNVWLAASHDGYRERFGLLHRRRLYLASTGDDLRGEDTLVPFDPDRIRPCRFAVRFHLHPDVQASLIHNGAAVLLRLPSGVGWRFHAGGGVPRLEDSICVEDGKTSRRTQQIAIPATTTDSGAAVKWAFQKVAAG